MQYLYNQDTGNLVQVMKLQDRASGTYITDTYHYNNPNFPNYITSIDNGLGIPIAQNLYDSSGRLISSTDANGNTTTYLHNLTNQTEQVVDALNRTNTYVYDLNGNVLIQTNALGQANTYAYDALNNKTNEVLGGLQTNAYLYSGTHLVLAPPAGVFCFTGGGECDGWPGIVTAHVTAQTSAKP